MKAGFVCAACALGVSACTSPTTNTATATTTATNDPGTPITIAFVGDILLDGAPGRLWERGEDPFAGVAALLAKADYVVGNLESPIATGGEKVLKKYTFRAHPSAVVPLTVILRSVNDCCAAVTSRWYTR